MTSPPPADDALPSQSALRLTTRRNGRAASGHQAHKKKRDKIGYAYVHIAIDGYSRLA
ncbi:MAG: hypothetical protein JWM72_521 [Actinomycetia bacterium]|jgi:hypothetical protein|nr:hypothetical protein [Actinomycetes bacterium]